MQDADIPARIHYCPDTGAMTWKPKTGDGRAVRYWNNRYAGRPVGHVTRDGYIKVHVPGRSLQGHRLAWFLHYGQWPSGIIDHADGNGTNNAISNLRDASHAQNCHNRTTASGSLKGVRRVPSGKWTASIVVNKRRVHLGTFNSPDEARAAYASAATANFGPFAKVA